MNGGDVADTFGVPPALLSPPSEATRKVMRGNKSRDTKPELALRRALHRLGLRYRLHRRLEVGGVRVRPDVVFPKRRVAVFVDGCFWHGCVAHWRQPKSNVEFWEAKVRRNMVRDLHVDYALEEAGWCVVRVWEHADMGAAAERVQAAVLWPEVGVRSTQLGQPMEEWDAITCCVPHPDSDQAEAAAEDGQTQYARELLEVVDDEAGIEWGRMCASAPWHCVGCQASWANDVPTCWCCGGEGRRGVLHDAHHAWPTWAALGPPVRAFTATATWVVAT